MLSVFRDNLNDIYIYIFWSPKFLHQAVMIDEISLSIWEFYFIGYRKQYVENLGTDDLCDFQEKTQGEKLHKLVVTVSSPLSSSTIPRYFFFLRTCTLIPYSLCYLLAYLLWEYPVNSNFWISLWYFVEPNATISVERTYWSAACKFSGIGK